MTQRRNHEYRVELVLNLSTTKKKRKRGKTAGTVRHTVQMLKGVGQNLQKFVEINAIDNVISGLLTGNEENDIRNIIVTNDACA